MLTTKAAQSIRFCPRQIRHGAEKSNLLLFPLKQNHLRSAVVSHCSFEYPNTGSLHPGAGAKSLSPTASPGTSEAAAGLIHLCLDTSRLFRTKSKRLLLTYTEVKPISFLIQVMMRMIQMAFPVLGLVWFHHSFFPFYLQPETLLPKCKWNILPEKPA